MCRILCTVWYSTAPPAAAGLLPSGDKGRRVVTGMADGDSCNHTGVNRRKVIHRSSDLFPTVDKFVDRSVDNSGGRGSGRSYFHWVETAKPAAIKPKPTTMFQFRRSSMGRLPSVT